MTSQHGDPAAMRTHAAALRQSAERLTALDDRVDRRVDALVFEGPAASRLRAAQTDRSARTRRAAQQLHDLADRVEARAAQVDRDGAGTNR